ncbi:uncharacterized protein FOMMEDRAFT_160276 [Fomitiporia mediterranea MF3/22]|uniref:uncharacterized protein n=1 Tax=Fomitiporia mediterranea (strain MF3/22) TaxID=694068 RepID=UPI0004408769|nr:uncharacterized protein FOMMEDRAFT_160276 [Fomitiporia mediterranea MF3/22]EJC99830.1 hypothetical protein FOMMEDRAFT_160276 [Fomitiporia mediterranea MF3/22]
MSHPDLLRSGNTSSGKFDDVKAGKDIIVVDGIVQPGTGGVSTWTFMQPNWKEKTTWLLKKTVSLGPHLVAHNDHGQHYNIEPKEEMTFEDYKVQLALLNTRAVRVDALPEADALREAEEFVLPRQSNHNDKATRFIFNALACVVHERVAIPMFPESNENDYCYLATLAKSLEDGSLNLSQLIWEPESVLKKDKVFTAAAVLAYMKKEEEARLDKGNEDAEADLANDHAFLRTIMKFDDERSPFIAKQA